MRHHRLASSIFLALALGACSKSRDSTELVVTVWSDLAVPADMDALRIQVTGTTENVDRLFPLAADKRPGTYQIPVQLVLTPAAGGDLAIRVAATGLYQGIEIVAQEAILSSIPDPARELVLDLAQSCKNVSCAASPGYTCENGSCAKPLVVDPTSLPTYVPGQVSPSPDAGISVQHSDAASGTGGSVMGSGGVAGTGGSGGTPKYDAIVKDSADPGPGEGRVSVDQASLLFGPTDVGVVSFPRTVLVTVTVAPVSINATVMGDAFAISANTCAPRQPVGSCTISVVFAPTVVGASAGTLNVGPVPVALAGTGVQPEPGVFSQPPDIISLGTMVLGTSAPVEVTINPIGVLPSLTCLPSGADLTLTTQTCPATGPVSARCTYTFTFKAATVGDRVDAIICSGGGKTTQTTVTAKVVTPPNPTVTPSRQDFTARVGLSVAATFSFSNIGGSPTGILTASITGAGFAITSNECPAQLAPLAVCKIQVTFAPATAGVVTGALTVTDATPGSMPAVAALTGTGITGPTGVITPATKDFGTVVVGQSKSAAFTITNGGGAASDIITVATIDRQFTLVNDLCSGHPLAPQSTCGFGVTFAPASVGLKQALVTATQASDGAILGSATLTGTGAGGSANLAMAPVVLDFGTTFVGGPVGPLVFTVTNTGTGATGALTVLKNDSLSSVGGAAQFKIASNTCAAALAPLATCRVGVTFDPTLVGSASAVIVVTDGNASTSPPAGASATPPGTVSGIAIPSISGLSAAPTWQEF